MPVDLHMHSTASDGECTPEEVVAHAKAAGLTTIALTDHDTVGGVAGARRVAADEDIEVIAGCEFSVQTRWGELHLLAYFLPLDSAELNAFLQTQRDARHARALEITKRLGSNGMVVPFERVEEIAAGGAIGRPHIARALVDGGHVRDIRHAFDRWIGFRRPAFVKKQLPEIEGVTELVRRLGGMTSIAHLAGRTSRTAVKELAAQGIDAVEVLHPSHTAYVSQELDRLADDFGLLRTGGSDWHGPSGEVERAPLGGMGVPEVWVDRLKSREQSRASESSSGE